jgi:low temperature requirement protein LtrA
MAADRVLLQYECEAGGTVVPVSKGGAEDLLRKPDQPPRATFLELFFDLVFVFALSRVSGRLVADLTSHHRSLLVEDGETLLLMLGFVFDE